MTLDPQDFGRREWIDPLVARRQRRDRRAAYGCIGLSFAAWLGAYSAETPGTAAVLLMGGFVLVGVGSILLIDFDGYGA